MIVKELDKKLKLLKDIIWPTRMALAVCFIISLVYVFIYSIANSFNQFNSNQNQYVINYIQVDFEKFLTRLSQYSFVNFLVPILLWVLVGIAVYIFVRLLVGDTDELLFDFSKRKNFLWPRGAKPHILLDFFERVLFRLLIFILIIIYFIHVVSPFLLGHFNVPNVFGNSIHIWLKNHELVSVLIFILLDTLVLFGVVVLLRLLFMKTRLLNSRG